MILRLAAGFQLNALLQNDGTGQSLSQGTPVHAYLAPDALRVPAGEGRRRGRRRRPPGHRAARGVAQAGRCGAPSGLAAAFLQHGQLRCDQA
ncbi:MAG: hypothetical protein ACTHKL_28710, partial [Streptosporangiaceae bacterium]